MFGDLPKLFDRNFITGYLLPAFIVVLVWRALILHFELPLPKAAHSLSKAELWVAIVSATWFVGLLLAITNREIYRWCEGYSVRETHSPNWSIYRILRCLWSERSRFEAAETRRDILRVQYNSLPDDESRHTPEMLKRRRRSHREMSCFPDKASFVLPTAFGNTLRAFEVYPRIMYGVDAIPTWPRLMAVIPDDFQKLIDAAKSQTDFWLNIHVLSSLTLVAAMVLSIGHFSRFHHPCSLAWITFPLLIAAWLSNWRAKQSGSLWGEWVKAAFDVYLPDLHSKLGFEFSENNTTQREQWVSFSRAIEYGIPDDFPKRVKNSNSDKE